MGWSPGSDDGRPERANMQAKIKYSLYKQSYAEFSAHDYNAKAKTIIIDLPDDQAKIPSDWKMSGNHYKTPEGARVYFWNSGLARNYEIEYRGQHKTIPAGFNNVEKIMEFLKKMV